MDTCNFVDVTWQFVSQFVSWEFCKKLQTLNTIESELHPPDLLSFFREMIVQTTTKSLESDITKHEIIGKFLEEIKSVQSVTELNVIVSLSMLLKRLCPELTEATTELLAKIKDLLTIASVENDLNLLEIEKQKLLIDYSTTACKILPVPDLVKACANYIQESLKEELQESSIRKTIIARLRNEHLKESEKLNLLQILQHDEILMEIITDASTESDELSEYDLPPSQLSEQPTYQDELNSTQEIPYEFVEMVKLEPMDDNTGFLYESCVSQFEFPNSHEELQHPINKSYTRSMNDSVCVLNELCGPQSEVLDFPEKLQENKIQNHTESTYNTANSFNKLCGPHSEDSNSPEKFQEYEIQSNRISHKEKSLKTIHKMSNGNLQKNHVEPFGEDFLTDDERTYTKIKQTRRLSTNKEILVHSSVSKNCVSSPSKGEYATAKIKIGFKRMPQCTVQLTDIFSETEYRDHILSQHIFKKKPVYIEDII